MRFMDILLEDHRRFSAMLGVLDILAARLPEGGGARLDAWRDVLEFFDRYAVQHHDQEETMLFPLLARHGIGSDQTAVHALLSQHEAGRVYGARLRDEFDRFAAGDPGAAEALAATVEGFIELVREHLRIEDEYFYALADRVLTEAEHDSVAGAFKRLHRDARGRRDHERYVRMAETYPALAARWSSST